MFKLLFIIYQLCCILLFSQSVFAETTSYRIVNGVEAEKGKWPWMIVQIPQNAQNSNDAQTCGGTLIHPQWVLTAGHCFISDGVVDTSTPPDIVIGRHDLSTFEGQRIAVSSIIVHPSYNPSVGNSSDVALLKLSTPISDVTPIALPGQAINNFVYTNGTATALGWGNMAAQTSDNQGDNDFPTKLQQLDDIPVVTNAECRAVMGNDIIDQMLCAGFIQGGKDTCQGDSGGPLFTESSLETGAIQIGVSSFGKGCAQPDAYGVYARVSQFSSWISGKICSSSEIPDAPVLQFAVNGQTLTASYNAVANATHYRLYYAPADTLSPINYIEMSTQTGFSADLPVGSNYLGAVVANNNNCISDFSNIEEFLIQ